MPLTSDFPPSRVARPRARLVLPPVMVAMLAAFACGEDPPAPPDVGGSPPGRTAAPAAPAPEVPPIAWLAPGKYGCSESIPRMVGGSYEYEAQGRGYVQIRPDGTYTDPFGVDGTYRHDAAADNAHFGGGALDGAVVTPLENRPNRLWVVIPAGERERRWTCSLV